MGRRAIGRAAVKDRIFEQARCLADSVQYAITLWLCLVKDARPYHEGHYMLAPPGNIPFSKFIGLLRERAAYCQKVN